MDPRSAMGSAGVDETERQRDFEAFDCPLHASPHRGSTRSTIVTGFGFFGVQHSQKS